MVDSKPAQCIISATIDAIEVVAVYIEEILESAGISMIDSSRVQLAVEEAVTNVVTHGYDEKPGEVSVCCTIENKMVIVTITDSGFPFDPTTIPPADVTADIEHRNIGGLGVHLIRSLMDEMTYQRIGEKNQLVLKKLTSDDIFDD